MAIARKGDRELRVVQQKAGKSLWKAKLASSQVEIREISLGEVT